MWSGHVRFGFIPGCFPALSFFSTQHCGYAMFCVVCCDSRPLLISPCNTALGYACFVVWPYACIQSSWSRACMGTRQQPSLPFKKRIKKIRSDITPDPGGHRPQRPCFIYMYIHIFIYEKKHVHVLHGENNRYLAQPRKAEAQYSQEQLKAVPGVCGSLCVTQSTITKPPPNGPAADTPTSGMCHNYLHLH